MTAALFAPLQLRDLAIDNRIVVSPMCQYSAREGHATDWHIMHLGQMAQSGAGLVLLEATAVTPEGRISPDCLGLWSDAHAESLARVLRSVRKWSPGAKFGVQLAHAGRKGSTLAPWKGHGQVSVAQGGWRNVAPSPLPFRASDVAPSELSESDIADLMQGFVEAAVRADRIGLEAIELHAAHGYLMHQFLSPLSNRRSDAWGGSRCGHRLSRWEFGCRRPIGWKAAGIYRRRLSWPPPCKSVGATGSMSRPVAWTRGRRLRLGQGIRCRLHRR
jgi:2,4-dienoyl-CoA reductase-like NADH-dependent reductase (Old Yellow Enzyme family)